MRKMSSKGFQTAGIASGIKKDGKKDLGLIVSQVPARVAGVFTQNRIQAAPVLLDKERIKTGICQAIIVNSGNANCCTGDQGMRDAKAMAAFAASGLGLPEDRVLVASTGVIGEPMPMNLIQTAVPDLIKSLTTDNISDFAQSIMTTDTMPKVVSRKGRLKSQTYTLTGVAKGSGMIRPDMATLLCFICTDAEIAPHLLQQMLCVATGRSFNRITIDGDTSTNDTVLFLANGLSDAVIQNQEEIDSFQGILNEVLLNLAKQLVKDGEGATKRVEITVKGALSDQDACQIADTVANSNLVKTAFFGEDANWGRILAAAGRAGVFIEPAKIDIYFDDVMMVNKGLGCDQTAEARVTNILKKPEFCVSIDLNIGQGGASVFTCDFSIDYVRINADYRS